MTASAVDTKEQFKVLFAIYRISKGYQLQPVWLTNIVESLNYSNSEEDRIYATVVNLKDQWLVELKYLGPGIVITTHGIKEVEAALTNPQFPTICFPANIVRSVDVSDEFVLSVKKIMEMREMFLQKIFSITEGNQFKIINIVDVGRELDKDEFAIKSVYEYLIDEGFIEHKLLGGGISITHLGIAAAQKNSLNPNPPHKIKVEITELDFPLVNLINDIIEAMHHLNVILNHKIGCDIFYSNAMTYKDLTLSVSKLEEDEQNQHEFIIALLCIGAIIDDVKYDEINKRVKGTPEKGSINLICQLLTCNHLPINEKSITVLRNLRRIRSRMPPTHMGEADTIDSLHTLGIDYPIKDFRKAIGIGLKEFLGAIREMTKAIQ